MNILGAILMLLSGFWIFYQDMTSRWIHIVGFLLFAIGVYLNNTGNFIEIGSLFIVNIIFLCILFAVLKLQLHLRKGKNEKMLNRYIGIGDVIILLIFCYAFNLHNLIVFIITSCTISLLYYYFRVIILKKRTVRIPLAGIMALNYIILNFINPFLPLSILFHTQHL